MKGSSVRVLWGVIFLLSFIGVISFSGLRKGVVSAQDMKSQAQEEVLKELTQSQKGASVPSPVKFAPDFKLQDTRQDIVTLSSYQGQQPILLFFWTTWCPYCQDELQSLNTMYQSLVNDGLELLAINVGETPDKVINHVAGLKLAYRILLDKDTRTSLAYELVGVPTYVLINKEGAVVFKDNYFPLKEYKALIQ